MAVLGWFFSVGAYVPKVKDAANFCVSISEFIFCCFWYCIEFLYFVAYVFLFSFVLNFSNFGLHNICQMQSLDMFPRKALEILKEIRYSLLH